MKLRERTKKIGALGAENDAVLRGGARAIDGAGSQAAKASIVPLSRASGISSSTPMGTRVTSFSLRPTELSPSQQRVVGAGALGVAGPFAGELLHQSLFARDNGSGSAWRLPTMSISSCTAAVIVGMSPGTPPRRPAEKLPRSGPRRKAKERNKLAHFRAAAAIWSRRMVAPIMAAG